MGERKSLMTTTTHLPFYEQVQHLLRRGERSVGCQKNIDIGRLNLTGISRGQVFHQATQGTGLYESNAYRLPFQMRNAIVRILRRAVDIKLMNEGHKGRCLP